MSDNDAVERGTDALYPWLSGELNEQAVLDVLEAVGFFDLRVERDRLRRVIDRYGRCDEDCATLDEPTGTSPCDCGYEACLYPALGVVEWSQGALVALKGHKGQESEELP